MPQASRIATMNDKRDGVEQGAETGVPQLAFEAYTGLLEGHTSAIASIAFSVDGCRLATADDTTVRVWETATGRLEQTLNGYTGSVRSMAFSPDGRRLLLALGETVWVWDTITGIRNHMRGGHRNLVRSVAFSPDGRSFVSASDDCTLRVWNAVTSTEQRTLQGHFRSVTSVAFSPDSHRLVSGSDDMTVRIWNMATGMQEQTLNGHTGSVRSVAFSLDSRWLASGSADKTVRVWDAKTGKLFRQLEDHPKWVWSVTFSPSGHWLASASDSTVRVWDISTGMLNQTLCGHTDWVRSVAFSPDGHWFASASDDRSLRVWDAATDISRIKSLFFPGRIGKLCETCKNLDIVTVSNQQISLENLKQQSKKHWRCQMCAVFWRCLEALLGPETPLLYKTLIINHFEGEQRGPLRADLIPHDPGRVRKIRLQFFPDIGSTLPWRRFGSAFPISSSALSERCTMLAREWVNECISSHKSSACKPYNDAACLPTRVIYVGKHDLNLRLHISGPGQRARYVALSHCWGGSKPLITTTENISSYIVNLPYERLPRTFYEAIIVTRAMGLDYIWIDSLCIIQNSIEDWTNEAACMATVYENAFVAISADAAVDCQAGFLDKPARLVGPSASVPYELGNVLGRSWKGIMHIREKGPLMRQMPVHGWHPGTLILEPPLQKGAGSSDQIPVCLQAQDDAAVSKLSTRGWVLQERLLSPRTLYFGPSELGWECRTCIKCECTATSARSRRGESLLKCALDRKDWAKLVKEYTRMNLTVPEDRLPAISGLASAMLRLQPNDRYLSGLWESTLADNLMWHVDPKVSSLRARFDKYYAPTWSWAHVIAPINYRGFSATRVSKQFEILEINYDGGSVNPFGPPRQRAFLLVRGLVVSARITRLRTGVDVVKPWQNDASRDLPQIRAILDHNHSSVLKDQKILFLMIRVGGYHGLDGLLLRMASVKCDKRENIFERFGYGYARRGYTGPRPKTYSSDSSAASEEDSPDVEAWPLWATVATKMELKIG